MSKESPIYAVPVDPRQIRDENPPEVTRIVEVTPPVEDRVITDDIELSTARLGLVSAVKIILRNGLSILGISAPEKM